MSTAARAYVAAFLASELLGAFVNPMVGLAGHALLIVAATNQWTLGRRGPTRSVALAFAVGSMLRLLSVALPLGDVPVATRVTVVGAPILIAIVFAMRATGTGWGVLAMRPAAWSKQLLVASAGIPLGIAASVALRSQQALSGHRLLGSPNAPLPILALVVFGAVVEELLFRGLIFQTAQKAFGRGAVVVSAAAFAASYSGAGLALVGVAALAGMVWGMARQWTGSIVGVVLAHALVTVVVFSGLAFRP